MKRVVLFPGNEGEVEVIAGVEIVLPKKPAKSKILYHNRVKKNQRWEREGIPKDLKRDNAVKYVKYIEEEFRRREEGLWMYLNGEAVWIPGPHYMYIQWSKIDIGYPEFRMVNRKFFVFWEACKKDPTSFGMCYLKNRRSGFSYMTSSELINQATSVFESRFGILSKTGADAKTMFTDKAVRIYRAYPFFFQPIQDGSTNPRMELAFREPAKKITKNQKYIEQSSALNSSLDWKNTGSNSYDGEKLRMLAHDESAKWTGQNSIKKNWGVTKTCLLLGRKVVGKCLMGSTANKLEDGGQEYKDIYSSSDIEKLNPNGQTKSGLWSLFIPAYENLEGFIDEFGDSVIDTPKKPVMGIDGIPIDIGAKEYLSNIREGLKEDTQALSEHKRQFPWTEEEAFRNDAQNSIFDVERIYQQVDHNETVPNLVTQGDFVWEKGEKDSRVVFYPTKNGKWKVSWMPEGDEQNSIIVKNGKKYPGNAQKLVGGCDPYDHDRTTDGRFSKGSLHILHKFTLDKGGAPMQFVCEYLARPPKAEMFHEDMLMSCVFFGCSLLVENNKIGLIRHFERRGYMEYIMERPENTHTKFSRGKQKERGIPANSQAVIQAQAEAVASYIYDYVGYNLQTGEVGICYFNDLLLDWAEFDIHNRTKFDATISSSLALLASQKVKVIKKKEEVKQQPFLKKYSNSGFISKKIR